MIHDAATAEHTDYHATLRLAAVLRHRTRGVGDALRDGASPQALLDGDPVLMAALPRAAAALLPVAPRAGAAAGDRLRAALDACGARFLPLFSPRYPAALRELPDPPPWLYYRGDVARLAGQQVAIVGSRRASHAGLTLAQSLASRLAAGGYGICSGMALGIDGAAHRGALERGHTVAVLGTGIDDCYPRRHASLAERIAAQGCVVSELPPSTAAHRGQFPRRNRIISGLAVATVIVEAALPSGSLHTAAAALEQGRDVLVFPWSVLHRGGAGCLRLLRDGATPLVDLDELEEHFPLLAATVGSAAAAAAPASRRPRPGAADAALLALIGDGCLSLQALQGASGLPVSALLAGLGRLEAQGLLTRSDGGYARAHCKPCQGGGS